MVDVCFILFCPRQSLGQCKLLVDKSEYMWKYKHFCTRCGYRGKAKRFRNICLHQFL